MRHTFAYELEDGTTGKVTTRAADMSRVEKITGDLLTRGMGFNHCAMLIHSALTREAKQNGTAAVRPFAQWVEQDLLDLEPVEASEPVVEDDPLPFEEPDSDSP